MSAGLDVFVNEPEVPKELSRWTTSCCFPHLGSATVAHPARRWTSSWSTTCWPGPQASRRLTPVPETPWPSKNWPPRKQA